MQGQRAILDATCNIEAQAFFAKASGNAEEAVAKMKQVVAIVDAIDTLSQPPYPIIPAHELFGTLLMDLNRPGDRRSQEG